jgi:hypothetical protein
MRPLARSGLLLLLVVTLGAGAAACSRGGDCTALVAVLDSARDRIKGLDDKLNDTAPQIAAAMKARVSVQTRTLEELERLRLTEPALQKLHASYVEIQRRVVRGAHDRAGIMEEIAGNGTAGDNVGKLEALCRGRDGMPCQPFFEALQAFPQDVDKETFEAAEHSRALADLQKIVLPAEDLRVAAAAVIASLRRSIAFSMKQQQVHRDRKQALAVAKEIRGSCRSR